MAAILRVDRLQSTDGVSKIILDNMPSGYVIASTTIRNSTRTAMSAVVGAGTVFGGSFTKQRSDTNIVATCTVFGAQYDSGNCAVGLKLDSTWDYGCAYQYDGAWTRANQTTIIIGQGFWTGITAGSHTMTFGWNSADSSTNRPFVYLNPNNSDDSRNQQMVSSIIIYEVYP